MCLATRLRPSRVSRLARATVSPPVGAGKGQTYVAVRGFGRESESRARRDLVAFGVDTPDRPPTMAA